MRCFFALALPGNELLCTVRTSKWGTAVGRQQYYRGNRLIVTSAAWRPTTVVTDDPGDPHVLYGGIFHD